MSSLRVRVPRRVRRLGVRGLAMGLALLLHLSLLISWRNAPTPSVPMAGAETGAQGISLSLASGALGSMSAPDRTDVGADAQAAEAQLQGDAAQADPTEATPAPADQGSSKVAGTAAPSGTDGEGGQRAASAATGAGGGYDRWSSASMAPQSFTHQSEPGLWEDVAPCYHGDTTATPVELAVVLGDGGEFVDAYPQITEMVVTPDPNLPTTLAAAIDALRACSPFKTLKGGTSRRLTLIVPGPAVVRIQLAGPSG